MLTPRDERFRKDVAALARAARTRGKQLRAQEVRDLVERIHDAYHDVSFTFSRGED
jgi:hypothetical protein